MNNHTESRILDPVLHAEAIEKRYEMGSSVIHVLKGVSLTLQQGERVAIMGASGSGKTTLLHVLGGLETPSSGQVRFQGKEIYKLSATKRTAMRARRIGYVFQAYYLLPELTVLENVMLPVMALPGSWRSGKDAHVRAEALLESVGLADRLKHLPTELSGGEQQRTAVVRALMNEPEIIFCDEPTGNLDSKTGEVVLEQLFKLVDEHKVSLLLVSHNQPLCEQCDRVLFLKDGCLSSGS